MDSLEAIDRTYNCGRFALHSGAFVYQLGHGPLKAERRVRFPYALPISALFDFPVDLSNDLRDRLRSEPTSHWRPVCRRLKCCFGATHIHTPAPGNRCFFQRGGDRYSRGAAPLLGTRAAGSLFPAEAGAGERKDSVGSLKRAGVPPFVSAAPRHPAQFANPGFLHNEPAVEPHLPTEPAGALLQ